MNGEIRLTGELAGVDWRELAELFERAPLGRRDPHRLQELFGNSRHRCFAYHGERLVGAARALADGGDSALLCDVVVLPEYQGQGLGRRLVESLLDCLEGYRKVLLYAVPGREGFYRRLGFRPMTTAMARFEDPEQAEAWGLIGR